MNRQKQYLADNVDTEGNVFPTIGENIRYGAKGITLPYITGITNVRLLTLIIDNEGYLELSEDVDIISIPDSNKGTVTLECASNIACSYPIMISNTNANAYSSVYLVNTESDNKITISNCPFNSVCVLLIGDKV